MFLSHLGNTLILVRYLDAIKEDLGKACDPFMYLVAFMVSVLFMKELGFKVLT